MLHSAHGIIRLRWLTAVVFLAAASVGGSSEASRRMGQEAARPTALRDVLPGTTLAYVDVPEFAKSAERLKETPLARILNEEEFQQFLAPVWKKLETEMAEVLQGAGDGQKNRKGISIQRLEFAITRMEGSGAAIAVALVEGSEFSESVHRFIAAHPDIKSRTSEATEFADIKNILPSLDVHVARLPTRTLCLARLSGSSSAGEAGIAALATALRSGAPSPGLSENPDFQKTIAKLQTKQKDLVAFARPSTLFNELVSGFSTQRRPRTGSRSTTNPAGDAESSETNRTDASGSILAALRELGFLDIPAIAFSESFVPGGIEDDFYFQLTNRRGVVRAVTGSAKPADRTLLERAPDGVDSFAVRSLDPRALYDAVVAAGKATAPQGVDPLEDVKEFETKHGVSIANDFFGTLGPESYSYSFPAKPDSLIPIGDLFWAIRLRERNRFEKCIDALASEAGALPGVHLEVSRGRATVFTLKLGDEGPGSPGIGMATLASALSPSFAILDDWVIASTNAVALKNEIRRMSKPRDASPDVKKAFASTPVDASAMSFFDPKPTVRNVYDKLAGLAQLAPAGSAELPIDLQLLPTSQSITKHLRWSVRSETHDAEGVRIHWSGSCGVETLGAIAGISAIAFAGRSGLTDTGNPSKSRTPRKPNSSTDSVEAKTDAAQETLRKLDTALRVYRAEHTSFPKDLGVLLRPSDDYPQGYLSGMSELPMDPWGSAYHYECNADGTKYQLRSLGPNKQDDSGKADDVTVGAR